MITQKNGARVPHVADFPIHIDVQLSFCSVYLTTLRITRCTDHMAPTTVTFDARDHIMFING